MHHITEGHHITKGHRIPQGSTAAQSPKMRRIQHEAEQAYVARQHMLRLL